MLGEEGFAQVVRKPGPRQAKKLTTVLAEEGVTQVGRKLGRS